MEYLTGILVAAVVFAFARLSGFDRDRVFYPTVLIVTATFYILFAAMANSGEALSIEACVAVAFTVVAVLGFRKNLWFVPAGLAGHGAFDLVHASIVQNPSVPVWWPGFCLSFDVLAGILLAVLLRMRSAAYAHY